MNKFSIFCFSLALFPLISHSDEGLAPGWTALPAGRPFRSVISDPRDQKMAILKNSRGELEADVAAYRSFTAWRGQVQDEDTVLHIGLEGGAFFVMRKEGMKFPLQSSDGVIGLYSEAARGEWLYQLRYTHLSAHLSDGLFNVRSKIQYTRETLSLRLARQFDFVRAYIGYHFLTHTVPALPRHAVQVGFYAIAPWHYWLMHPFFGTDYLRRNAEEGNQLNFTGGIAFLSDQKTPPIRLSVSYFKGHDMRGQYFWERTSKWSMGLDLDF